MTAKAAVITKPTSMANDEINNQFDRQVILPDFPLSEYVAKIDSEYCDKCGDCRDVCTYEAISEDIIIDYDQCSGCGNCVLACPNMCVKTIKREEL